jgi:2-polyprenyl-6-methoxyphenol hydroxylase-like FAD-dependent oxidoreductase
MSKRKAIVIGGGIGGLATAAGLSQMDWRVTVFEQAPRLAPVGAGITLAPNAVRALDRLGVGDVLRERSVATGAAGLRTASGRWLLRTTVDQLTARQGLPAYALHRADLHDMLLDAAGEAELRTGHHVTGVTSKTNGAEVSYTADGGEGTASAELVVAADGVHSVTRHTLHPHHPPPAYAGYITWRGVAPAEGAPSGTPGLTESWGRGHRFGIVPLADGRVYWFAAITGSESAHANYGIDDLAKRFACWHDPIAALLDATPADTLLRHPIYHLSAPLPTYGTGRVALLGDAAHAMTPDLGQGACQALEDAVVLVACAADHADVPVALAAYDRTRRARTQQLVQASARVARLANTENRGGAWLRDLVAWVLPVAAYLRATDETFGWQPPARPTSTAGFIESSSND